MQAIPVNWIWRRFFLRKGFSFKGIHSNTVGVSVKTRSRPILPEAKRITFEPAAADGSRDLSSYNSRGRVLYNERQFTIDIHVSADGIAVLQQKLTRIASWLSGAGELVFDDLPAVIWKASVFGMLDYAPEKAGKRALLSAVFTAAPFSYAPFTALSGVPIGSSLQIGSKIPIGLPALLSYQMSASGSIDVINVGTAPTRPVITINDPYGTYTVEINGVSIEAGIVNSASADAIIIDCESYSVRGVNSSNSAIFSGTFPELAPGTNNVLITNSISWGKEKTITVDYLPRFLYGWEV